MGGDEVIGAAGVNDEHLRGVGVERWVRGRARIGVVQGKGDNGIDG